MSLLSNLQRPSQGESLAVTDRLGASADGALIQSVIVSVAIFSLHTSTEPTLIGSEKRNYYQAIPHHLIKYKIFKK